MKHFPTFLEIRTSRRATMMAEYAKAKSSSMEHFVLDAYAAREERDVYTYSQPLALWMFVPCGEDGEPMEKPDHYEDWINDVSRARSFAEIISLQDYEAAQKRVLFEGWELTQNTGSKILRKDRYMIRLSDKTGQCTVEGAQRFIAKEVFSMDGFINTLPFLTPTQSALTQLNIKP
ncbi:MAG: hypothetical protein GQ553_02035 [Nitrosomonadaceae bacterium]|nr:hypothetical protein [Nitrosomonadaceae bacterium]